VAIFKMQDNKEVRDIHRKKYLDDADEICKDVVDHFKNNQSYSDKTEEEKLIYLEDLLAKYQNKYKEFSMSFPIVLRYMVQMQQYNRKAFDRYIRRLYEKPYRSEEEYCKRQSEYVMYLYMEVNPRSKKKENEAIKKEVYDMLLKELNAFKEAQKKTKEEQEKNNRINNIERRKELKDILDKL
jgi:hypothetical protein